jgi:hypothetical protein
LDLDTFNSYTIMKSMTHSGMKWGNLFLQNIHLFKIFQFCVLVFEVWVSGNQQLLLKQ